MAKDLPYGYKSIVITAITIFIIAVAYQSLIILGVDLPTPYIRIPGDSEANSGNIDLRKVTKVIDGDTLKVEINGLEDTVRLIGINSPEIESDFTKEECFGPEASRHLRSLAFGETVKLVYDDTQGMRDGYDRLLAYIYLDDGQMLNRKMVAEGFAYEYTYIKPYQFQKEFRELANFAKREGRGLWSAETCSGLK